MMRAIVRGWPRWVKVYLASTAIILGTTAMHIPDGYLGPATCIVMYALVLPFWVVGVRKLRQTMNARSVPLIALTAAFSFVIMMFNLPLPGGTTGHAVGAALAAILLGPEIATISISVALIVQAFLFGDGGIMAIGANCFNMGVVIPYISYALYQRISGSEPDESRKRLWGAAVGAYVGLAAAAFLTAVEFGIQPALHAAADGAPLYAPYPLSVAIPAMMIPHLLVACLAEAVVTVLVMAYLQRSNVSVLKVAQQPQLAVESGGLGRTRGLWIILAVLIVLSPLGLLAPGTAWGEWGAEEFVDMGLGFIPRGLEKLSGVWGAPMPDYEVPGLGNASIAYVLSAVVGIAVSVLITWLFVKLLSGRAPAEQSQ